MLTETSGATQDGLVVASLGPAAPDLSGPGGSVGELRVLERTERRRAKFIMSAPTPKPLCVVKHPELEFAYSTSDLGSVTTWAWGDGRLLPVARVSSGGRTPCHLAVDPSGSRAIVTNYGSGSISVLPIEAGVARAPVHQLVLGGSGPVAGRQASAHPHHALFLKHGRSLAVTDLGADRVIVLECEDDLLGFGLPEIVRLPPGTGPRHSVAVGADSVVLTGELAGTVCRIDFLSSPSDANVVVVPSTRDEGHRGDPIPGDIVVSPSGTSVFVSNRARDGISRFDLSGNGGLELADEVQLAFSWPTHLSVVGDELVVCARDSDAVVAIPILAGDAFGEPYMTHRVPRPAWTLPLELATHGIGVSINGR